MIRRASYRKDRATIIGLIRTELWPYTRATFPARRFSHKEIIHRLRKHIVFVHTGNNGSVDGFIMFLRVREWLMIDMLAVNHRVQGRGIGSTLLRTAERYAITRGLHRIRLLVDEVNSRAINFYEKMGYNRTGYVHEVKCIVYDKLLA